MLKSRSLPEFYVPPAWSTGHISHEDAAFLDDMVREVSPDIVIEVGVASGCSSAVILRALAVHTAAGRLHSFDAATHCYFAPDRPIGSGVAELDFMLGQSWSLHTDVRAGDAGILLRGRGAQLCFIDANHRHPWPTLDVLALLPALSDDAWIVLHDIRLPEFSECQHHGPMHLFRFWPGEKRASKGVGNIGAIRLGGRNIDARSILARILQVPWEVEVDADYLDRLAIASSVRAGNGAFLRIPPGVTRQLERCRITDRPVFIWGAGASGECCLRLMREFALRIDGVVDRDSAKHGRRMSGFLVMSPGALIQQTRRPFVLIASMYSHEIESDLISWGFAEEVDFLPFQAIAGTAVSRAGPRPALVTPACGHHPVHSESRLLGMTTWQEQDYLYQYARSDYRADGAIVDLGCWLGSTTIPLARGLEENSRAAGVKVNSFDTFVWHSWMDRHAGSLAGTMRSGDSFVEEFQRQVAPVAHRVRVHVGDLVRTGWNGGPIEFLLIDAMKSWTLCAAISRSFLPAVMVDVGLVMHQDFKFWGCPWIHLTMFRMRECFALERDLEKSAGTVFRLKRRPASGELVGDFSMENYSVDEIDAAYEYWRGCLRGPLVHQLDCAQALALSGIGEFSLSKRVLTTLANRQASLPEQFIAEMAKRLPDLQVSNLVVSPVKAAVAARDLHRSVWLWGAGTAGRQVLKRFPALCKQLSGVIDRDAAKHGQMWENLVVTGSSWLAVLPAPRPFILIATSFFVEIVEQLEDWGYSAASDFLVVRTE